jgi:hypothetical protein
MFARFAFDEAACQPVASAEVYLGYLGEYFYSRILAIELSAFKTGWI